MQEMCRLRFHDLDVEVRRRRVGEIRCGVGDFCLSFGKCEGIRVQLRVFKKVSRELQEVHAVQAEAILPPRV